MNFSQVIQFGIEYLLARQIASASEKSMDLQDFGLRSRDSNPNRVEFICPFCQKRSTQTYIKMGPCPLLEICCNQRAPLLFTCFDICRIWEQRIKCNDIIFSNYVNFWENRGNIWLGKDFVCGSRIELLQNSRGSYSSHCFSNSAVKQKFQL